MREDPLDGDLHERARWLADRTGLDGAAIWEWGVVERVSTGLLGTRVGLQPVARQMLDAADRKAAQRESGAVAWVMVRESRLTLRDQLQAVRL